MFGVKKFEIFKFVNKIKLNCFIIYYVLILILVYNICIYLKSFKYRKGFYLLSKMLGLLFLIYILNLVKKIVFSIFFLWFLFIVFFF